MPNVILERKERSRMKELTSQNLMDYHIAIAVVDKLVEEGFISKEEARQIYTIIAEIYGINLGSIFAA